MERRMHCNGGYVGGSSTWRAVNYSDIIVAMNGE